MWLLQWVQPPTPLIPLDLLQRDSVLQLFLLLAQLPLSPQHELVCYCLSYSVAVL